MCRWTVYILATICLELTLRGCFTYPNLIQSVVDKHRRFVDVNPDRVLEVKVLGLS